MRRKKMRIAAIILWLLTAALFLPGLIIAYGTVLGHTYTSAQGSAAGLMAFAGLMTAAIGAGVTSEI